MKRGILTTVLVAAAIGAQADVIEKIDARMQHLDRLIHHTEAPVAPPDVLAHAIELTPDSVYATAVDAVADARISAIKAQTGLQLTGQAYYRPDSALGIDEEEDAVSPYVAKVQVEARWYFLQSGLLKRSGRIQEQRIKADIDRLKHERGRADAGLYAQREALRAVSDSVLASVMLHRVDNLNLLEEAYLYLLGNENISSDELLKVIDERSEAERRLNTLTFTPVPATSLASVTACVVSVDTARFVSEINDSDIDMKILDLQSQLLDRQADNTTWWSDVRLAPFVRYSHYFRRSQNFSQNVDAGLSFTIPINDEASRQRKALRAQKGLVDVEREDIKIRIADRVRYLDNEIGRLNRAIEAEWQRAARLRQYLSERRKAYDNRAGEYNRLAALKEYNAYLRSLESIVDFQYRRDSYIADLQSLAPTLTLPIKVEKLL